MYEATNRARGRSWMSWCEPVIRPEEWELAAGQVVHESNDPADVFYVIESGEIRLYDAGGDRTARLLEFWAPTEWFGSEALAFVADLPQAGDCDEPLGRLGRAGGRSSQGGDGARRIGLVADRNGRPPAEAGLVGREPTGV